MKMRLEGQEIFARHLPLLPASLEPNAATSIEARHDTQRPLAAKQEPPMAPMDASFKLIAMGAVRSDLQPPAATARGILVQGAAPV
jgi:hypothetical protein